LGAGFGLGLGRGKGGCGGEEGEVGEGYWEMHLDAIWLCRCEID